MKNPKNIKQGKKNRASGKAFERKTREDLENKGWIIFRNFNNVEKIDTPNGQTIKFKQSKPKFNPFTKSLMMIQSGMPDFLCIKQIEYKDIAVITKLKQWDVQFCECKSNGYLTPLEREKIEWIKNNLYIPVFIAKNGEKRGMVEYNEI